MSPEFTLGFIMACGKEEYSFYQPLGLGYLCSYLKEYAGFQGTVIEEDLGDLLAHRPDVVGISSTTLDMQLARNYARRVKRELGVPVLLGGVHITTLPRSLPEEFDVGVIGEGEETLRELVELFRREGAFPPAVLQRVPGLCYRENGRIRMTAARELIKDLDRIPLPDRDALGYHGGATYMLTSRGCPYRCRFCASRVHWGKRFRCFSARKVVEEIGELVERYHTESIHLFDDVFVANRSRLEEIARLARERGLDKKVSLSCAVRAEAADESLIETLKSMNVVRVTFGAESNSARVLSYLKRGRATPEANQRAVDLCWRGGLQVGLSFIKGVPGETLNDIFKTYDFIFENIRARKIDIADVNDLAPFPGTEIWDIAKARGLVAEDMDWDELKQPWKKQYLADCIPKQQYLATDLLARRVIRYLKLAKKKLLCLLVVPDPCEQVHEKRVLDTARQLRESRFFDCLRLVAEGTGAQAAAQSIMVATGFEFVKPDDLHSHDVVAVVHGDEAMSIEDLRGLVWHHLEAKTDASLPAESFGPADRKPVIYSAKAFQCLTKVGEAGAVSAESPETLMRRPRLSTSLYRASEDPFRPTSPSERVYMADLERVSGKEIRKRLRNFSLQASKAKAALVTRLKSTLKGKRLRRLVRWVRREA